MDITVDTIEGQYHHVRLAGDLRGATDETLPDEVHPLVAQHGLPLVIDLAEVATIDSAGLSQLVELTNRARMSQTRVLLVGPTPFVAGVFKLTRLDQWFEVVEDLDAARQKLTAPS